MLCCVIAYFLVHNDVHSNTGLGLAFKDPVETVVLMEFAWSPKIQLRREPPILEDGLYASER